MLHHPQGVVLLPLQLGVHVQAGLPLVGLHQGVDVVPLLRPHVAEQVRGDGLASGHLVLAVLLREPGAHVAVQLVIERLHLPPQPLGLLLEGLGRHVVAGAPERAQVLEADLLGALVGELHQALVERAHRLRDGVPAHPGLEQLVVVAALGDDVGQLAQVLALALAILAAVLALAVEALELRGDAGQLRALLRIARRRQRGGHAQQVQHARGVRVQPLHVLEARGLLDGLVQVGHHLLVHHGRVPLGVVGDVGGLDPLGRGLPRPQPLEILVHSGGELASILGRGSDLGGLLLDGRSARCHGRSGGGTVRRGRTARVGDERHDREGRAQEELDGRGAVHRGRTVEERPRETHPKVTGCSREEDPTREIRFPPHPCHKPGRPPPSIR